MSTRRVLGNLGKLSSKSTRLKVKYFCGSVGLGGTLGRKQFVPTTAKFHCSLLLRMRFGTKQLFLKSSTLLVELQLPVPLFSDPPFISLMRKLPVSTAVPSLFQTAN